MRSLPAATLFVLLLAPVLQGEEPLVWKWAEGDTARYLMTQTMRMTVDAGPAGEVTSEMRQDLVMNWRCVGQTEEGAYQVEQSTERVVISNKTSMGQGFHYDTDDEDPPAGMAALVSPVFQAMVESPFTVTMKPSGEFVEVSFSDELARALDRLPGGAVSSDMVTQMAKQSSLQFPEDALAVGDQWTNTATVESPQTGPMEVLTTYVYNGPRSADGAEYEAFTPAVQITSSGNPQGAEVEIDTTDSTGEVLFDRDAGRLFRSRLLQTMDVVVRLGEQQVANQVEQGVELRCLAEGESPTIDHTEVLSDPQSEEAAEQPSISGSSQN